MNDVSTEKAMEMFRLRCEGYTYEEIAKQVGGTRQNVQQTLERCVGEKSRLKMMDKIIYPGLSRWMRANKCNTRLLWEGTRFCSNSIRLRARLTGKAPFTLAEIKILLSFTGLTFEEAFGEVKTTEQE